jgi:hypothetical protein
MRLRRLAAAEMVRTPARCRSWRGCVSSGGVEAGGDAVRLDVYCVGALSLALVPPEVRISCSGATFLAMRGRDSARPPARWRCSTAKRCTTSWRWVRGTVARRLWAHPLADALPGGVGAAQGRRRT